ncbi:hypothetical protein [Isoptericola cucumis]|uniref:Uncharacterized protein n=1 Tax=Isoptericola cucumis TaxID=1776856 RepID=A0ABQ2B9U2_9MICO|nr:hypothetical protein [Isoptericola cucumis]GGI11421.1 hypothetical protein GCM10007368_36110 [Isoptericola cucumis]
MGDTQWQKLDGNADLVRSKGHKYQEIADAIERATTTLDAIVDDASTTAESMDETKSLASDVKEDISKATERYRYTGDALVDYASALDTAISESETAANQIASLEDDLASARTTASNAQSDVDDLPKDAPEGDADSANSTLTSANSRVSSLESSLSHWQGRWTEAKGDKDGAATTAKNKIDEVVSGDKVHGLEDGFWDKAGEVWDSIYKVVKVICDIAGILAIFLSWVPILGQILLVLAAVGAILAVVDAVFKAARGQGSWWGVLGAAGLAALTLFGGKAISVLAKYSKARTVVQTASRMSPKNAKSVFGTATLKSTRKVFAQTNGQRVTEVLKSPFIRSATDKQVAGLFRGGNVGQGLKTMFPNPFTGTGMRTIFGNDDVTDMFKFMNMADNRLPGINGTMVIDGVTAGTSAIAAVGGHGITVFNGVRNSVSLAGELGVGDFGDASSPAVSLGTSGLGGPYGNIIGNGLSLAGGVPNPG